MPTLDQLDIQDLRPRLKVKANPKGYQVSRRARTRPVSGCTIHYNGPALAFLPDPARELRQIIEVDVPNHQQRIGMDSLAYHFCVLSDGQIWQTRYFELIAWHCGHVVGNEQHIAIHLPLGGEQDATVPQWRATTDLMLALGANYSFGRWDCKGHMEWKATACPGELMPRLKVFRNGVDTTAGTRYSVPTVAILRSAPNASAGAVAKLTAGQLVWITRDVAGQNVRGSNIWYETIDGRYVHSSGVVKQ